MPNYRALMMMPADGGDLVRAIREDSEERAEVRDYTVKYPEDMREPTKRETAMWTFEHGDHAPPEMREKQATKRGAVRKHPPGHINEAMAFEAWLNLECPAGDVTSVQEQWLRSVAYADWCEQHAPAASEPVKRGGWVMHDPEEWFTTDDDPAGGIRWVRLRDGRVQAHTAHFGIGYLVESARVIAYSTDETCPEWTGEAK